MPTDEQTRDLVRRKLLGWGVRCDPIAPGAALGRDVRFEGGDLDVVVGLDNLAQDLTFALTTALGSDPFNVNYGFDGVNALMEETDPLMVRERVRVSVVKLLNNDPRVRRILDVKLLDGRLGDVSDDTNVAEDRRILNVRVAFETVSNDQAVVDLGGAGLNV